MTRRIAMGAAGLAAAAAVGLAAPALADMAQWKATANTLGTFLPKPMKGWKTTKLITSVANSAFQKHILARRVYRTIASEGVDTQINLVIQGSPGWKKQSWTFPCYADRTSKKCQKFDAQDNRRSAIPDRKARREPQLPHPCRRRPHRRPLRREMGQGEPYRALSGADRLREVEGGEIARAAKPRPP